MARGEDTAPLVPTLPDERFESSLDLEWPIDGLEPLSFVLTRLLEPLSARLERRDRGAAIAAPRSSPDHAAQDRRRRRPAPTPSAAAVAHPRRADAPHAAAAGSRRAPAARRHRSRDDRHRSDAGPGRAAHAFYACASDAGAALDAAGAPGRADGAGPHRRAGHGRFVPSRGVRDEAVRDRTQPSRRSTQRPQSTQRTYSKNSANSASSAFDRVESPAPSPQSLASALRRCRQPVPARAVVEHGRPTRVTTDRRGFAGGAVRMAAGPWRTSGNWWAGQSGQSAVGRAVGRWQSPVGVGSRDITADPCRLAVRGTATNGTSRSPTARCIACSRIGRPAGGSSMRVFD